MFADQPRRPRGIQATVLLAFAASAATGCVRRSELVLHQPFAPPSQRQLRLSGRWTFYSAESPARKVVLAFSRPGAADEQRDFLIYLSLPADLGEQTIDPADPAAAQGFLIQTVGRLKGKVPLTAGTVRCRKVWPGGALRRLELDVRGGDGTKLVGQVYVRLAPREIHAFEQRHAADVALLARAASRPAARQAGTAPRGSLAR